MPENWGEKKGYRSLLASGGVYRAEEKGKKNRGRPEKRFSPLDRKADLSKRGRVPSRGHHDAAQERKFVRRKDFLHHRKKVPRKAGTVDQREVPKKKRSSQEGKGEKPPPILRILRPYRKSVTSPALESPRVRPSRGKKT